MFWRIKEWKKQGDIEDLSTGDETTVEEGLGEDDWVDKGRRGERVEVVGNVVEKHFSIVSCDESEKWEIWILKEF